MMIYNMPSLVVLDGHMVLEHERKKVRLALAVF